MLFYRESARVRLPIRRLAYGPLVAFVLVVCATSLLGVAQARPVAKTQVPPGLRGTVSQSVTAEAFRKRERYMASPLARQRRQASRTAYRHMSSGQAFSMARRFAGSSSPFRAAAPRKGVKIRAMLNEHQEVVRDTQTNKTLVMQTNLPLQATDASGKLAPTDLTLQESASGFKPVNSPSPVVVGRAVSDGVTFMSGDFKVRWATPNGGGLKHDKSGVFFGNAGTDTDVMETPRTFGATLDVMLRSPLSPTEQTLIVDLPPGRLSDELCVGRGGLDGFS